jgi:hypothetical protein
MAHKKMFENMQIYIKRNNSQGIRTKIQEPGTKTNAMVWENIVIRNTLI